MDYKDDEFDIEIIDIDSADGETSKNSSTSSTHSPLMPRFSPRQRRIQLIITVSIVGLLLLGLLGSYAPVRTTVVGSIIPPIPSPTATLVPGINSFYFDANPPWGHLFVDGKLVPHPPNAKGEAPLQLSRGRHTVRWTAASFTPQQCMLSVPANFEKDTCPFNQFIQQPKGIGAWLLNFPVSLAQMPEPSHDTLISEVQAVLDAQAPVETVLPGESYAVASLPVRQHTTYESLKAKLHYQLDTQIDSQAACSPSFATNGSCNFFGQDCHLFCTESLVSPVSTQEWQVLAVVRVMWDYAAPDGKVIAQQQPETADPAAASEHLVPLQIEWNGTQWHITTTFSLLNNDMRPQFDPTCSAAAKDVAIDRSRRYVTEAHAFTNWEYVSGSNLAAGCLGIATLDHGPGSTPSATEPVAYCLYRFGVFIAANDIAHKYWPDMPLADAYEQHLAQQLAATQRNTAAAAPSG